MGATRISVDRSDPIKGKPEITHEGMTMFGKHLGVTPHAAIMPAGKPVLGSEQENHLLERSVVRGPGKT